MWGGGEWTTGSVGNVREVGEEEEEDNYDDEDEEEIIVLEPDQSKMQPLQAGISRTVSSVAKKRTPLLVLDLNGLLVDRIYIRNARERQQFLKKVSDEKITRPQRSGDFLVFLRPGCKDFLRFVMRDFDVAIWSSARKRNIHPILKLLFTPSSRRQLHAIYGQEECQKMDNPNSEHKPLFIKDLRSLWETCGSAEYTLLVDDSPEKAQFNPPHTSIHPPAWGHANVADGELERGGKLREFLKDMARASQENQGFTVSAFLKENPFATYTPKTG